MDNIKIVFSTDKYTFFILNFLHSTSTNLLFYLTFRVKIPLNIKQKYFLGSFYSVLFNDGVVKIQSLEHLYLFYPQRSQERR